MSPTPVLRPALLTLLAALAAGCAQAPRPAPAAAAPAAGPRALSQPVTAATYGRALSRWQEVLTGGTAFDPEDAQIAPRLATISGNAQRLWDTLDTSPGRTFLWPDLASTTVSAHVTASHDRLRAMALAYATKGAPLHHNPKLRRDLIAALDWLAAARYNAQSAPYDNWFDWEIGTPLALLSTVVLLGEHLSPEQVRRYMDAVERFSPDPRLQSGRVPTSGANRVWKATVVALRGLIVQDPAKVALARDSLGDVFAFVTAGDGFYEDGSFIQHEKHPYTGGYGKSLLLELSGALLLLADTPWEVTDPRRANVFRWVREAFEPLLVRGAMMDLSRGREVSRSSAEDHVAGHDVIRAVLRLAEVAPPDEAASLRGLARQAIEADTHRNFFAYAPIHLLLLGRAALAAPARPAPVGHWTYAAMDRAVHRREGWAFGVAMSSARIFNYESINGEHLRGWYTADGMTALYGEDLGQYSGDYWATVNPYRLPGTTVDTRPREAVSKPYLQDYLSAERWAGGVNLGGYGAASMKLDAEGSSLEARKSWFMFDDEVVALGAGISSRDGRTIETTVDNRKLSPGAGVVTGGPAPFGERMDGVRWLHVDGAGGYVLPGGADLRGVREARTGAWRDINAGGPTQAVTRDYATLYFDHGVNPAAARYAYVALPTKTAEQTRAYEAQPDIEIVQNTEGAQVVRETRLGVTAATFWAPGRVGTLRASTPAAVMVRERGAELDLALSDPTQVQGTLGLEVRRVGLRVVSADPGVRVLGLSPIRLEVDTAGARGRTFRVTLAYDPAATVPEPAETALPPLADAYVRSGVHGATTFGAAPQLVVANSGGDFTRQSYLKFDLSRLAGAVTSARLYVHGAVTDSKGTVKDVEVRGVADDAWTEAGLTWNTRPPAGAALGSVRVDAARAWRAVDVTAYVQSQQAADPARLASLALTQDGAGLFVDLSSREGAQPPYLLVTADPTLPVRPVAETDVPAQADATVRGGVHGDTNYGAAPELVVSSAGGDFTRQSYLKFDLSLLSGEVAEARLMIHGALTDGRGGSKDVGAYGVEDDTWTEGGLTWNTRPPAGALVGAVGVDTAARWREIDVTAPVRRAAAGDRIASLVLAQEGAGLYVALSSREGAQRPYLRVTTYR